jgi:integrase
MMLPLRKAGEAPSVTKSFDIGRIATRVLARMRSENTRKVYHTGIVAFCDANRINDLDAFIEQMYQDNQVIDYIETMIIWLQQRGKSPLTITTYLSGVKKLFRRLKLNVDRDEVNDLLRDRQLVRGIGPVTRDEVPNRQQLRKIISHLPVHGKALYLTLLSSGLRLSEALALAMDDLHLDETPARIVVRRELSKRGYGARYTFISDEAKDALQTWFTVRQTRYKKTTNRENAIKIVVEVHRKPVDKWVVPYDVAMVFDYSHQNARKMWRHALTLSGLNQQDKRTRYHIYHVHTLRKFFSSRSQLKERHIKFMMGHKTQLERTYNRETLTELRADYLANMHHLEIYEGQLLETQARIQAQDERIQELEDQLARIQQSRAESDHIMDRLFQDEDFKALLQQKLKEIS